MNYPSNPNPNSSGLDDIFFLDPYFPNVPDLDFSEVSNLDYFPEDSDVLGMIEEYDINSEGSPSSTWSLNSSEKAPLDTISPSASVAMSFTSLEIDRDEKKKKKRQEHAPIHVFRTKSDDDVLDDGYSWRKYGKKPIRGSPYPRHYHKCKDPNCTVKKKIERDTGDPDYVLTTYEGKHNHGSPSVIYCDPEEIEFMSQTGWCFKNNFNLSRSAP